MRPAPKLKQPVKTLDVNQKRSISYGLSHHSKSPHGRHKPVLPPFRHSLPLHCPKTDASRDIDNRLIPFLAQRRQARRRAFAGDKAVAWFGCLGPLSRRWASTTPNQPPPPPESSKPSLGLIPPRRNPCLAVSSRGSALLLVNPPWSALHPLARVALPSVYIYTRGSVYITYPPPFFFLSIVLRGCCRVCARVIPPFKHSLVDEFVLCTHTYTPNHENRLSGLHRIEDWKRHHQQANMNMKLAQDQDMMDNDDKNCRYEGYFTYRPLSNLPTPPPSSRNSSAAQSPRTTLDDGEPLMARFRGESRVNQRHVVSLMDSLSVSNAGTSN